MVYDFKPLFVRPANLGKDRILVEMSAEQTEEVIKILLDRPGFSELVSKYSKIRKSQNRNQLESEEIALRGAIFPIVWQALEELDANFVIFTADVGEEVFHRFDERDDGVNR